MKRIFSKRNLILFVIVVLLGMIGGGYLKYIILINKVREAYQIELPTSTKFYNTQELKEYEELLATREFVFERLDVDGLQGFQKDFINLDVSVNTRLLKEYFVSLKSKITEVQLVASNMEEDIELQNKKQLLLNQMLQETNPKIIKYVGMRSENNYSFSYEHIKEEYEKEYQIFLELQQKIQKEINTRVQQASSPDNDSDYSESNKPANSQTPSAQQTPPTNDSEVETPPTTSEETCVTKPDGAVVCVGGDW